MLGARQVGKSTLARQLLGRRRGPAEYFDLESTQDLARLREPSVVLQPLRGLVVLDEVHRLPEIFRVLRVLADRPRAPARFLVLGSASENLLRQASESLAGRIAFHGVDGFALEETGAHRLNALWLRGGFPRSFLARSEEASREWRQDFVRTFLERDVPQFGIRVASSTLGRFWAMLAHAHGQIWSSADFASSFGVAHTTVRHYLDLLVSTFVVQQLLPWHENLRKRQVKAPKVYVGDSGLLHTLLDIRSLRDLERHPKLGASWEGFAIAQVTMRLRARPRECYFWATHAGAELDLLVVRGSTRLGFEIKRTDAPVLTPSMRIALHDLKLDRLDVIHAGRHTFPMAKKVRAVALERIIEDLEPLPS